MKTLQEKLKETVDRLLPYAKDPKVKDHLDEIQLIIEILSKDIPARNQGLIDSIAEDAILDAERAIADNPKLPKSF